MRPISRTSEYLPAITRALRSECGLPRSIVGRPGTGPVPLTPRERELVELVRQGLRNRDIAQRLGVTEGTVKVYLHSIFDKVGVGSRTELAIRAAGLIGS